MKNPPPLAHLVADGISTFITTLQRRKTRIEASDIISVTDENGRMMEVYYRVIDAPPDNQSDASGDSYTIEQVLYKSRRVTLTGRGEQELLLHLNMVNPKGVKYQYK